jgi:uracil-DNA glycosylase family 4
MADLPDSPASESQNEPLAALVAELRAHLTWADDAGLSSGGSPPIARKPAPVAAPGLAAKQVAVPTVATQSISVPTKLPPTPETPMARAPAKPAAAAAAMITVPGTPNAKSRLSLPTLDDVRTELGECTRCKLHKGRTNIVFGVGNPKARLVFVGEAPGEDEDLQGIPFVGRAGQLLTKMIEAMGVSRDEVYICNTVKCRPPNNRNPEPDELGACEPFLKGQLAALQAEAIVTLGKFASQALLRDETPISRLRGTWREYNGVPLMPTFHPSYLLRSPGEKGKVWSDLQQVMTKLGLKPRAAATNPETK